VDLSVIIVNYNSADLLKRCIKSIHDSKPKLEFEIIIVDNASREPFPQDITLNTENLITIVNPTNKGFAKANNKAFDISSGDMILFLNPDVEVLPGTIDEMYKFLKSAEKTGAAGCMTYWNKDEKFHFSTLKLPDVTTAIYENTILGKIFPNNHHFKKLWDLDYMAWSSQKPVPVMGMPAAILMIKKDILNKIGGYDKNFFLYYEDKDLCKRIRDIGYDIFFLPNVYAIHRYGQSAKKEEAKFINDQNVKSRNYYYKKHYGFKSYVLRLFIIFNKLLVNVMKFFRNLFSSNDDFGKVDDIIKFSWDTMKNVERYCLEISVDPNFLHKVAMFLNIKEYILNKDTYSMLPPANYFWRCVGFLEDGSKINLKSGNFVKK
jgi:GT2 family glycosyltransferase